MATRKSDLAAQRSAARCRRTFLTFYPGGFQDPDYLSLERGYKERAHLQWREVLDEASFAALLRQGRHAEVAQHATRIESRTNLLFSFEKMALRDAVKTAAGARAFAQGLFDFLHGGGSARARFEAWVEAVAQLPRRQTRVLTWPLLTVFGFVAQPRVHMFLKPNVTRAAARAWGFDFVYRSRPEWEVYASLLAFAREIRRDLDGSPKLRARDQIDLQGFIWVQGSDEYAL